MRVSCGFHASRTVYHITFILKKEREKGSSFQPLNDSSEFLKRRDSLALTIMKKISRLSILFLCLVCPLIFYACSGSGGSDSTTPSRYEPAIVDCVLAIDVTDERPDGITDTFFDSSDRIYVWVYWENVDGRHTVDVDWFSPGDDIDDPPYRSDKESFTSSTGTAITWFYIDQPVGGFDEGEWFVDIYLDEYFERSLLFMVE